MKDFNQGVLFHSLSTFAYRMSSEYSKHCHYLRVLFNTIGSFFCGVSLLTLTAISVDRLLALLLRLRYRQVVTLKRVWLLVAAFWFSCTAVALTVIYSFRIAVIFVCIVLVTCIVTSTSCYGKIYLTLRHHQTHVQGHVNEINIMKTWMIIAVLYTQLKQL